MNKVVKILAVVAVIIGVIVGIVLFATSGVDKMADDVMAKFHAGKYEQVYNESLFPGEMDLKEFSSAMGIGSEFDISKAEKVSWVGRGFKDNKKYIFGDFLFSNGSSQVLTFTFMSDGGKLKLSGITAGEPE